MTTLTGPAGAATLVPVGDPTNPKAVLTVCQWLIQAPGYHPCWDYYSLAVVELREHPEFPPSNLHFPGASHELLVVSLHPDHEPYDVAKLQGYEATGDLPFLTPPGVCAQFAATEAEMRKLSRIAAQAIVDGTMSPEPPFSARSHWDVWQAELDHVLAHLREGRHEEVQAWD